MLMIGILDVAIVGVVILLLLWFVPNVVRYLAHKAGGAGSWLSLSDKWIEADKKRAEQEKEQPKGKK